MSSIDTRMLPHVKDTKALRYDQDNPGEVSQCSHKADLLEQQLDIYEPDVLPATHLVSIFTVTRKIVNNTINELNFVTL